MYSFIQNIYFIPSLSSVAMEFGEILYSVLSKYQSIKEKYNTWESSY